MLSIGALLVLFGAARFAVIAERTSTSVRLAELTNLGQDPSRSFSFDTVYSSTDRMFDASVDEMSCSPPLTSSIRGGAPFTTVRTAPFWLPLGRSTSTCDKSRKTFANTSVGQNADLLIPRYDFRVQAGAPSLYVLASSLDHRPLEIASQARFFEAPSLETILQCYTNIGDIVSSSLHPSQPTEDAVIPTPIPANAAADYRITLKVQSKQCVVISPLPGPYTTPLPAVPVLNYSPTPIVSASPPNAIPTNKPSRTTAPTTHSTPKPHPQPSPGPSAGSSSSSTKQPSKPKPSPTPIAGGKSSPKPTSPPVPKPSPKTTSPPTPRPSPKPTSPPTPKPSPKPTSPPTQKPSPKPTSPPKPSPKPKHSISPGSAGGIVDF